MNAPKLVCSFSSLGMFATILYAFKETHKCLCQAHCIRRKSGSGSLKAIYLTKIPYAGFWKQKYPQAGKECTEKIEKLEGVFVS